MGKNKVPLHVLSISFYGQPLQGVTQLSGASARQKDYAELVEQYVVVVRGEKQKDPAHLGDGLYSYTLPGKGHVGFFVSVLTHIRTLHRTHAFDVVMVDNPHVAGVLGLLVKYMFGITLLVHSMADMPFNPWYARERWTNRIKSLVMRLVLRFTDYVRVSTQAEVERLVAHNIPKEKIVLLPFYIDAQAFAEKLTEREGESHKEKMVLFVGRLGSQKDIVTLLRAWEVVHQKQPDATFVLVGGGPDETFLQEEARNLSLGKSVIFTGAIPYDEVAKYFAKARLFAISSLYEGTCMVLHEAAVARLPIVSTDHAGAKDFIEDGVNGYLVPVRDSELLGQRILELLDSKERGEKMGSISYDRLSQHSREEALRRWHNFFITLSTHPYTHESTDTKI